MFASKLPASVVPKFYEFRNISKISSSKFYHSSKILYKKSRSSENITDSPKCKMYQETLNRCPKLSEAVRCCKRFFKQPAPKCKEQAVTEDYQEACTKIRNHGNSFLKDVQVKLSSTLNELNSYVEAAKKNEEAELEKLFSDNKAKLSELMSLDVSFASGQRKCALSFNHQTRRHIETLRRDLMSRVQRVCKMAERVEQDTMICIDRAECLINSCRKCKNAEALKECIEENNDCATRILEEGFNIAQNRLKEIDAYKHRTMNYYKLISAEAIKTYIKENAMFAKYLDDCIYAITKKRK